MKVFLALLVVTTTTLFVIGTPFSSEQAAVEHRWKSPEAILPMSFAHLDHVSENCLVCHHNYVDDTGDNNCMECHVTNQDVWSLLEEQFHEFCRGCHEDKQLLGDDGGPTRVCIDCHVDEQLP